MASRALWTGSLTFGLVSIPVRLFPAVAQKEVHFHLLHEKDKSRVKQKLVCSKDGEEVARSETIKGYELAKGCYVPIDPAELKKYVPEKTDTIDISDFVALQEIDPIYYEHTYQVLPDKGGAKAYGLLRAAMVRKERVAIAHVVMRTKQYLCAVRPTDDGLLLSTMQYADEILPMERATTTKPGEKELKMAEQLIDTLAGPFEPQKYHDRYREEVLALIDKKAKGKEIAEPEEAPAPAAKTVDLMEALRASLERRTPARSTRAKRAKSVRRKRSA